MGFEHLNMLKRFTKVLATAMDTFEYDLDLVAGACRDWSVEPEGLTTEFSSLEKFCHSLDSSKLKAFALAFMEDSHEFSRVSHFEEEVNRANQAIATGDMTTDRVASLESVTTANDDCDITADTDLSDQLSDYLASPPDMSFWSWHPEPAAREAVQDSYTSPNDASLREASIIERSLIMIPRSRTMLSAACREIDPLFKPGVAGATGRPIPG